MKPVAVALVFAAGFVTGAVCVAAWWAYKPRRARR